MQHMSDISYKWANYAISHVRVNRTRTHIDSVMLWPVNDDGSLGNPDPTAADIVIGLVERSSIVKTMTGIPGSNRYFPAALVRVLAIGGSKFLTTEPNGEPNDNLGGLPEF